MTHASDQSRPQTAMTPPQRTSVQSSRDYANTQAAATNLIRHQIDAIYGEAADIPQAASQPQAPAIEQAPPQRPIVVPQPTTEQAPTTTTHGLRTAPPAPQDSSARQSTQQPTQTPQATPAEWQHYHSSWQKYYQLYYERYYANHLSAQQAKLLQQATTDTPNDEERQQQAMRDLRAKIRSTVKQSAQKVKKSRHFVPVLAGLAVMLIFTFLQYNRVIFGTVAAYTSPGNIDPQNIIVDPTVDIKVGPEPRLIIPKINVDAPIVYGAAADVASQRTAMEKGVAHFSVKGASATPGQYGNTVLAAHSSNDAFASGAYKFIFAQNEKLQKDDIIYINHQGTRYTYRITRSEVVLPHEVGKIQIGNDKPMLTLISCVPLGTAEKRLLLFAEQISPSLEKATRPSQDSAAASANIPGKPDPTLLERLFGAQ